MASLEDIRAGRLAKLELLKKAGVNPFPIKSSRQHELSHVKNSFEKMLGKGDVVVAGRIMAIRGQGAIQFIPLFDGTATFQAVIKKDVLDQKLFELFTNTVDIGDIIEVTGELFLTIKGEKSLLVKSWSMLAKSLRPLPEKWNGLQDVEERFRRRYLDTIMSEDVRNRFVVRGKTITTLRSVLDRAGYLEVETPMLQTLAGGANAEPFKTHHNALDIDLSLRIAPELYLKKLLIGGFPKVYEMGRNFRNEGIDVTHNPEFTMLEFYEAFSTAEHQMHFVEKMCKEVVSTVLGTEVIDNGEAKIDFSKPFTRITYKDLVTAGAGLDPLSAPIDEVVKKARKLGVKVEPSDSREKIIDNMYKKVCRPHVIQPTFVTDYPVNMIPLAKKSETDPSVVDVFQLLCGGLEIVKAFSELNDPIDQRERFTKEEANAKAGDTEAQSNDDEFIEALEYGMPPAGGVGIGIDRLCMLLTNSKNIKEVILFPTMRPRESEGAKPSKKEREVAVAIINESAATEGWQKLNTAAHLGASLAARRGRSLLHTDTVSTKDGDSINLNIQHAIVLKTTPNNASLIRLAAAAKAQGLQVEQFTREMIVNTNDKKVIAETLEKDSKDVERLGILIFGPKDAVDALTRDFPLAK